MTKQERLEKMEELRSRHPGGKKDVVEIGEFTYGTPIVRKWDNTTRLTIGKFCSIGGNVQIFLGGEHHLRNCTTYPFDVLIDGEQTPSKGDVRIGNDVWIGENATILSGVTIGDGAVIGAGAVIASDVESYGVMIGNPARMIKLRVSWPNKPRLMEMQWWDWPLDMIADAMPMIMSDNVEKLYEYWKEVVAHE